MTKISEKFQKGDAGTAGPSHGLSSESSITYPIIEEDPAVSITGTDQDMSGRVIPLGEPMDDVKVREIARYFDLPPSEFRDGAKDLAEILQFVSELTGQTAMSDLLLTISQMEDAIKPAHANVRRHVHFRNYLLEKMAEFDVKKRVRAWEI